ncbi:hypothetical protein OK074_5065 [Actinobacteria bacterium OK074]|nr:hypothetical protein OK074_5065 [Actinobacteria bacterium OK074]
MDGPALRCFLPSGDDFPERESVGAGSRLRSPARACGATVDTMGSYDGAAVVIADGVEYEVHAKLWCTRTPPRRVRSFASSSLVGTDGINWGGTLRASGETDAFAIYQAQTLALRPDGGLVAPFTFQGGGDLAAGVLPIRGSGTVPFDCR